MARDYVRKLAQMRAYSKTPAGRAAHERSYQKRRMKLADGAETSLTINPAPLLAAINHWR